MLHFDMGCVYRSPDNLSMLAVTNKMLIAFKKGKQINRKPNTKYPLHSITVGELCDEWKIDLEALDKISTQYMVPPTDRRIRGTRQPTQEDIDYSYFRLLKKKLR
jgi:hypothetical protein